MKKVLETKKIGNGAVVLSFYFFFLFLFLHKIKDHSVTVCTGNRREKEVQPKKKEGMKKNVTKPFPL